MNRTMRRCLIGLLLTVALLALCTAACAAEKGKWGELSWKLDDSGVLTVSGQGGMEPMWDPESDGWRPYADPQSGYPEGNHGNRRRCLSGLHGTGGDQSSGGAEKRRKLRVL